MSGECTVDGCGSPKFGLGYCQRHRRHYLAGKPLTAERQIFSRHSEADFWARVEKTKTCWLWTKGLNVSGYGKVQTRDARTGSAHRVAYEYANGPIADGLVIDHLCRNKRCVRPDHLEAVSPAVNTQRGASSLDFSGRCLSGKHAIVSEADFKVIKRGVRVCRRCVREGNFRRRELIARAAASLGLSPHRYSLAYGMSIKTAQEILGKTQ